MSLGYASKLSYREDLGGQLGSKELFDPPQELENKISELSELIRAARNIVVFTGAGISTACGIPDFRGPSGVWTMQRAGQPLPKPKTSFVVAKPSYMHQALVALHLCGKLRYVVSQNVDSLHLRSGIPRDKLAELHGNCFAERCARCGTEYIRDFEMETVGFKYTRRSCTAAGCSGRLRDFILDWEDALPEAELEQAETLSQQADLALCLGTSLQITPACNIPLKTVKAGGKMVIVNLQKTPKDKKAHLVIHARCDDVFSSVCSALHLTVPPYIRRDAVVVRHEQNRPKTRADGSVTSNFVLYVESVHGPKCPLPLVDSVSVRFEGANEPVSLAKTPFCVKHTALAQRCRAHLTLQLVDGVDDDKRAPQLEYVVDLQDLTGFEEAVQEQQRAGVGKKSSNVLVSTPETFEFVTQVVHYSTDAADAVSLEMIDVHLQPRLECTASQNDLEQHSDAHPKSDSGIKVVLDCKNFKALDAGPARKRRRENHGP